MIDEPEPELVVTSMGGKLFIGLDAVIHHLRKAAFDAMENPIQANIYLDVLSAFTDLEEQIYKERNPHGR